MRNLPVFSERTGCFEYRKHGLERIAMYTGYALYFFGATECVRVGSDA